MYGIHKLGFIDPLEELAYLKGIENKDFFVLIKGRRRIGKTRITYEAFNDYIYVFIWPDKSVGWILERIAEEQGIPLFSRFSDMLNYLLDTGKVLVSLEFGSDSKIYTTILSAIASGKTKLREISALFGKKSTSTVKYLDTLRKEFNLVRRETPIFEDPKKSKNGIYEVRDNFLSFWYYFIDRRRDYIEQERFSELISQFERDFPAFAGRKFEKFVTQLLREGLIPLELPWKDNQQKVSCIPLGTYSVKRRHSDRFKEHFHIQDVPNRTWILIHPGNYYTQIMGCVLVGGGFSDINNDWLPGCRQQSQYYG